MIMATANRTKCSPLCDSTSLARPAYGEYRFNPERDKKKYPDRLREMWFAGVHSDVGGYRDKAHLLSDIALGWMADEAIDAGLLIDEQAYKEMLGTTPGQPVPVESVPNDHPLCDELHENSRLWALQAGWHHRIIRPGDDIHPSVFRLIAKTANSLHPYRPRLP
jgi:hypothetical protein